MECSGKVGKGLLEQKEGEKMSEGGINWLSWERINVNRRTRKKN